MAINYFADFPKILYTLDDYESQQVVTDIFKRIILEKELIDNTSFYETYDIVDNESPENVSMKYYGTPYLHWLILITNNIVNPKFEWPMSQTQLFEHVKSKYGGEESIFTRNNALDAKGYRTETYFLLTEDSTHKNPKRLTFETSVENVSKQPIAYADSVRIKDFQTNYDIENNLNESRRNIKIIKPEVVQDILTIFKTEISK